MHRSYIVFMQRHISVQLTFFPDTFSFQDNVLICHVYVAVFSHSEWICVLLYVSNQLKTVGLFYFFWHLDVVLFSITI